MVAPVGDIDLETARQLRAALLDALDTGAHPVVVDLAAVGFMDSTGIGQLAWLATERRGHGAVVVANTRPLIRNALHLTGLDLLLSLHEYGTPPPADGVTDTT